MVNDYSVVIPAFNAAQTIGPAIESILAQSPPPKVIIVVDDGSTDATAEVVAKLQGPIVLIRQANAGPGPATTRGLSEVSTDLIATLDADDLWRPGKMALQLEYLQAHPQVDAVFCHMINFREQPEAPDADSATEGWSRSTMLIRRTAAAQIGAIIDPPGRVGEMVDWFARAREQGLALVMQPQIMTLRRIRPGSLTWGKQDLGKSYLHVARAALLRRRAAQAEAQP